MKKQLLFYELENLPDNGRLQCLVRPFLIIGNFLFSYEARCSCGKFYYISQYLIRILTEISNTSKANSLNHSYLAICTVSVKAL